MGFFGGLGSALSGAGQQAPSYRESVTNRWVESKNALADLIAKERANVTDTAHHNDLFDIEAGLRGAVPGKDITSLVKRAHEAMVVHPNVEALMKQHGIIPTEPKQKPPTGPPAPGMSPGSGLSQMIAAPATAATPATNPIAGGDQSAAPKSPPTLAPAPIPPAVGGAATVPAPTPVVAASQSSTGNPILDRYYQAAAEGFIPAGLAAAAHPFLTNAAELQRQSEFNRIGIQNKREGELSDIKAFEEQTGKKFKDLPVMFQASFLGHGIPGAASLARPIVTRNVPGTQAPQGQLDYKGEPISHDFVYDLQASPIDPTQVQWIPVQHPNAMLSDKEGNIHGVSRYGTPGADTGAVVGSQVSPHYFAGPNGQEKVGTFAQLKQGIEPAPIEGVVNPATAPKTTTSSKQGFQVIDGMVTPVTTGSSSTVTRGGATAGAGSIPPARSTGAGTGPSPRVGTPLGASQSTFKMQNENPLTPEAQKVMIETTPVLTLMDKVKGLLEKEKDSNVPAAHLLDRIAYTLGFASNGELLSAMELGRITQAAAVLKGSGSRARQILEKAMIHTADAWKDSPKLMVDKINNIESNIYAIQHAANQFGQRYPGLTNKNGVPSVSPGSGGTVKMQSPDGRQTMDVPSDQVDHYKSRGAKVVQ